MLRLLRWAISGLGNTLIEPLFFGGIRHLPTQHHPPSETVLLHLLQFDPRGIIRVHRRAERSLTLPVVPPHRACPYNFLQSSLRVNYSMLVPDVTPESSDPLVCGYLCTEATMQRWRPRRRGHRLRPKAYEMRGVNVNGGAGERERELMFKRGKRVIRRRQWRLDRRKTFCPAENRELYQI